MAGLIPLLIALTIIETAAHRGQAEASGEWSLGHALMMIGLALVAWLTVLELAGQVLVRQPQLTRRWLQRWDVVAQTIALGGFALLCYGYGWATRAEYYCLALAPWILAQSLHWWCFSPVVRMVTGVPWGRWGLLWHQLRFSFLPLFIAMPILDLCAWIARVTPIEHWLFATYGEVVNVVGGFLMAVSLVTLLPWLLVRLWGAVPLEASPLQSELAEACTRAEVSIGAILRWPIRGGGRVYNAMVIGVLPRLRYVLFTDDLLRDFQPEERIAVLGHELGHARHQHLWLYLLFALFTGLISWAARGELNALVSTWPLVDQLAPDVRTGALALILLGIQWRLLFGYLSRACERQADLAGAELAGNGNLAHGTQVMCLALHSVARLAGIDPRSPSWRHYSIAERVAWLERVGAKPALGAAQHRQVALIARLLAAATGILLALTWAYRP